MPAEKESPRDPLTGLPGRGLLDVLDPPFRVRGAGETWSVMLLELLDLDSVRNEHGKLIADQMLQQTAYMLARNTKKTDELMLLEKGLFALVLPSTNRTQAINLALRLAGGLKQETFPGGIPVAFNLGIAESADVDRDLSAVMEKAGKSLEMSRSLGSGRIAACSGNDPAASGGRPSFDHFVNRAEQLSMLRNALDSSISDGLAVVAVTGPAGIGKTRLASELSHYAGFRGCRFASASLTTSRFHTGAGILDLLLPRLRGEEDGAPLPQAGDPVDRLAELSSKAPLVAIIDDLQSAGPEDLEQIASLVRRAAGSRILLVILARTPLPGPLAGWLETLGLFIHVGRIDLPRLSDESAADLICLAIGTAGADSGDMESLTSISGGNPQNLEELLRNLDLSPSNQGQTDGGHDFSRMADFAARRVESASQRQTGILAAASVVPWHFTPAETAFMSGIEPGAAELLFTEAVDAGFLARPPAGSDMPEGTYRFVCEAVRSAVEPSGHERRALLTRLGDFHSASAPSASRNRRAAWAYCLGIEPVMALDLLLDCADDAAGRSAGLEREEWLGMYRAAAAEMAVPPEGFAQKCLELGGLARRNGRRNAAMEHFRTATALVSRPEETCQALHLLGKCLLEAGDFVSAGGCFDRMKDLPSSSPELAMTNRVALAQLKHSMGYTGEAVGLLSDVEGWLEGGMEGLGGNHLRSEFLRVYGTILAADGDPSSGFGMCCEASEIAEKAGDAREQIRALVALAGILSSNGSWEERYRILRRADSIARASGDMEGLAGVWAGLGAVHMSLNQVEIAEGFTEKAAKLAEMVGCPALGVDSEIIT
ncbi:MAG TPA: AAA family ATPase, partial [Candidatus Fermentibacter sp.]|nr:AAA family ATPase [Candidatus Fermentibacter sp.]